MTADPAQAISLNERGVLRQGMRADTNIVGCDRLLQQARRLVSDLPASGRRIVQGAIGCDAALGAGEIPYRAGEVTEPFAGRVVRL